eukprot:5750190-Prymnesium_polylepis.1
MTIWIHVHRCAFWYNDCQPELPWPHELIACRRPQKAMGVHNVVHLCRPGKIIGPVVKYGARWSVN